MSKDNSNNVISEGRAVIEAESRALSALVERVDHEFEQACELILSCGGRLVVIGMGKSGHIGGKLASTFASTGTPAFFVHPGEASHGDLGMITPKDLVLALSNSGETPEVLNILPMVKRMGVKLIAITGDTHSTLAKQADACVNAGVDQEACPLNLAPTTSTTAALAMGDALAVAVYTVRGFSANDFARTHPGGKLGRRLLLYVKDIMHSGDSIPMVNTSATLENALLEMTSKSLGMTGVIDANNKLVGIFTDGDLRRTLGKSVDVYSASVATVMTTNPFTVHENVLAAEVLHMMREHAQHGPHAINGVFVVDQNKQVVGAFNTHDLLRAGII